MKKILLAVTISLIPIFILFVLTLQDTSCASDGCLYCIWEDLQRGLEAWDRLMLFWFYCAFLPISFIAHAQAMAMPGVEFMEGIIEGYFEARREMGMQSEGSQ